MKLTFAVFFLLLFLHVGANAKTIKYGDVKITHLTPVKTEALWLRTKQVTPRYPVELAQNGIAGCGVFSLTVDENGKSKNIELISSVPKKGIFKSAKRVIKSWDWSAVSNNSKQAENKLIRLDFCLGGDTQNEAQALCAEQAKLKCN